MKAVKLFGLMFALSIGTGAAAVEDSVMKELVPTGKLRVAIAVSPAPSALYVIKGASGGYRGVAIDLGSALAKSSACQSNSFRILPLAPSPPTPKVTSGT